LSERRRGRFGGRRGDRRWHRRPRKCHFCTEKIAEINYKDANMLRRFINDRGKIRPRRQTGTCARHQRKLARAIKRARHLAMLPFTADHLAGG
jgi:small subunit ribosomal protein S18